MPTLGNVPRTSRGTMRAAVIAGPQRLQVADVPVPEPGPGEVLVRLEGCGVCASNLPVWEGRDWFEYPREPGSPGHEAWGKIEALGPGVTGLAEGDRVACLSQSAYALFDVAPADAVVKLPPSLNGRPFPAEPLGCAVNVFRRSDIREGQTVAIVGIGFLGALLVQQAVRAGARVLALSRREDPLAWAERLGAAECIPMDDHWQVIEKVRSLTGGNFCERVIECTGYQWPLDLSAELCAEYGRLMIAGYHQDGPRQINMQLWNWRGLDVINAHERDPAVYRRGMEEAVRAVAAGELTPDPLYTHVYRLDQLDQALSDLQQRPEGFMKGLILT